MIKYILSLFLILLSSFAYAQNDLELIEEWGVDIEQEKPLSSPLEVKAVSFNGKLRKITLSIKNTDSPSRVVSNSSEKRVWIDTISVILNGKNDSRFWKTAVNKDQGKTKEELRTSGSEFDLRGSARVTLLVANKGKIFSTMPFELKVTPGKEGYGAILNFKGHREPKNGEASPLKTESGSNPIFSAFQVGENDFDILVAGQADIKVSYSEKIVEEAWNK